MQNLHNCKIAELCMLLAVLGISWTEKACGIDDNLDDYFSWSYFHRSFYLIISVCNAVQYQITDKVNIEWMI